MWLFWGWDGGDSTSEGIAVGTNLIFAADDVVVEVEVMGPPAVEHLVGDEAAGSLS